MQMMPWKITDEVMAAVVENINASFHNLKIDELNVLGQSQTLYTKLDSINKRAYRRIATRIYRKAYEEATGEKATKDDDLLWTILSGLLLLESDPVSKYLYDNEVNRKKDRFAESMMASAPTRGRDASIIRSRNLWIMQSLHYGDRFALEAMRQAYKDAGVEYLQWRAQKDNRVCERCEELDNEVFLIDDFPPPQHYHCRCYGTIYRQ